jgi:hypothetical protein
MMRTALLATALFAAPAALAVPMTFTHQGRIADAAGRPVNGEQTAVFRLYSDETNALPWTETHQVSLDDGYYSVELGVQTPLDATWFNTDELWFGITINGSTFDQLMSMNSTPFAIHAGSAGAFTGESLATNQVQLNTQPLDAASCDNPLEAGTLRWNGFGLFVCDGTTWSAIAASPDGSNSSLAAKDCVTLKASFPSMPSSPRWVDPDGSGSNAPLEVWCDMDTGTGGWMVFARVFEENNSLRYGFDAQDSNGSMTADTFASIVGVTFTDMAFIRRDTGAFESVSLPTPVTWPAFGSHANNGNGYTVATNPDHTSQVIRAYDADSGKHFQLCFRDAHNDECGPTSASDPGNYGDAGGNDGQNMLWQGNEVNAIGTGIVWDFAIR